MGIDWTDENAHGVRRPIDAPPTAVAQRSTVDVTGANEALVVGPDEVLVVTFPADTSLDDMYEIRSRLLDSNLRTGQIILIAGAEMMAKVQRDREPGRAYVRPQETDEHHADRRTIEGDTT